MDDISFSTITELYRRIYPALITKKSIIERLFGIKINELDLWNYFKNNIWPNKHNLFLCDMVDDILNESDEDIYFNIKKLKKVTQ